MRHTRFIYSRPRTRNNDVVVRNGLAITPAQMEEMISRGIPVNANALPLLEVDAHSDKDFSVSPEFQRGASLNSTWNAQIDSRQKLQSFHDSNPVSPKTE
jgi:hypothetical protein